MADADDIVLEALLDDVLDESIVRDAVEQALQLLLGDDGPTGAPIDFGRNSWRWTANAIDCSPLSLLGDKSPAC